MKKLNYLFALIGLLAASNSVQAQNTFFEDFNSGNALSNWTLIDVDGGTPAGPVAYVNDAWVIREDFDSTGVGDSVAVSTSWYAPAGSANDYMITPMIITGSSPVLQYDAKAQDPAFPDGYELLISTTDPTVAGLGANPALFTIVSENANWTNRTINLAAYANDTIYLGWRNNSDDDFLLLIDNVRVFDVQANDASVASITVPSTVPNTSTNVTGTIVNAGASALTSVIVNYTVNNGSVNRDTLSLNLTTGNSATFSHNVDWTPTNPGSFSNLKVWTSMPNGVTDGNAANDTLSADIFVNLGNSVARNSVFEQFTTSVCQFCPDGAYIAAQMEENVAGAITTSVHSCFGTDNMTNAASSALCSVLGINAAPTGMVDRKLFDGENAVAFGRGAGALTWQQSTWVTRTESQIAAGSPANIIIAGSYETSSRQLAANVEVSLSDYILPGTDVRISLQIIEDSVIGSGPGWDQVNFYNGQVGHPFFGRGNPIPNYAHRRVLRTILPANDIFGASGTVPQNYQLNTGYTESFTYTVPQGFDASKMYLVATVNYFGGSDISQYEILNATRIKMDQITSNTEIQLDVNSLNIYPNPSELPFTNLEFNLSANNRIEARIIDVTGKEVSYQDFGVMSAGNQRVQLNTQNLENGFYFVNLRVGDQTVSRKISILK